MSLLYFALFFYMAEMRASVSASRKKYDGIASDTAIFKYFKTSTDWDKSTRHCLSHGMLLAEISDINAKLSLHRYLQSLPSDSGQMWIGLRFYEEMGWGCTVVRYVGCWHLKATRKWHWDADLEWESQPDYENRKYYGWLICGFMEKSFSPRLSWEQCDQYRDTLCMASPQAPSTMHVYETRRCQDSIKILWTTAGLAKDLIHRFRVIDLDTQEPQPPILFVTALPDDYVNEKYLTGLKSYTNYKIELMPCLTLCCCHHIKKTIPKYHFKGKPLPVASAEIRDISASKECEVTWSLPERQPIDDVQGYKITDFCTRSEFVSGKDAIEWFVAKNLYHVGKVTISRFQTTPNCQHVVFVQTKACGLLSEKVKAKGNCEGEALGFDFVPSPGLIRASSGNMKIRISLPKEPYGPASCLFLVTRAHEGKPTSTTFAPFSLSRFRRISKNKPGGYSEYISLAIRRSVLTKRFLDVEASGTPASSCNVANDGAADNTFTAWKAALNPQRYHSIFVVVSLPSSNGALLMRSASTLIPASQKLKVFARTSEIVFDFMPSNESVENTEDQCIQIGTILAAVLGALFVLELAEIIYLHHSTEKHPGQEGDNAE